MATNSLSIDQEYTTNNRWWFHNNNFYTIFHQTLSSSGLDFVQFCPIFWHGASNITIGYYCFLRLARFLPVDYYRDSEPIVSFLQIGQFVERRHINSHACDEQDGKGVDYAVQRGRRVGGQGWETPFEGYIVQWWLGQILGISTFLYHSLSVRVRLPSTTKTHLDNQTEKKSLFYGE